MRLIPAPAVRARFGDNYDWTYNGQLELTNSLVLHNYRDVWGYNWADWTYHIAPMNVHENRVSQVNANHPDNTLWAPAGDAALLVPFMTTPDDADVGVGTATRGNQADISLTGEGVPARLSSFTTRPVTVRYLVQDSSAATLDSGIFTFEPGETLKIFPVNVINPQSHDLIRVSLSQPENGEITGSGGFYYINGGASAGGDDTLLIARGAEWKFHDLGQDLFGSEF